MVKWLKASGFMMEATKAGIISNLMDHMLKAVGKEITILNKTVRWPRMNG